MITKEQIITITDKVVREFPEDIFQVDVFLEYVNNQDFSDSNTYVKIMTKLSDMRGNKLGGIRVVFHAKLMNSLKEAYRIAKKESKSQI